MKNAFIVMALAFALVAGATTTIILHPEEAQATCQNGSGC
jgi:hypothetical protein